MASLTDSWDSLTKDLNDNKVKWWNTLIKRLSNESRKYHNVKHLEIKYKLYGEIKHLILNKEAMEYAIFFSYFEYDPRSLDSDKRNVELFKSFCADCGISLDSNVCKDACDLLSCIGSHITEEHKTSNAFGNTDKHYFLDLDMAVLGTDEISYEIYTKQVRGEYDFLAENVYKALRLKVLQTFLQIPNIFSTKVFREKYEEQARRNILKEISLLTT